MKRYPKKRAEITNEQLPLAVQYFSKRLATFEEFEQNLFSNSGDTASDFDKAKKTFSKARMSPKALSRWADTYVNAEGWKRFKSRLRQQKRKDKKTGGATLVGREFSVYAMQQFDKVKECEGLDSNDDTLIFLCHIWKKSNY